MKQDSELRVTDKDRQTAFELTSEHFDRDDMGRLRGAIATALVEERERNAEIAYSLGCKANCGKVIAAAIKGGEGE